LSLLSSGIDRIRRQACPWTELQSVGVFRRTYSELRRHYCIGLRYRRLHYIRYWSGIDKTGKERIVPVLAAATAV
jgi:hypothetical protein